MLKIFQLHFNVENRQDLDYHIICHIYKALTIDIYLCIQYEACIHIWLANCIHDADALGSTV